MSEQYLSSFSRHGPFQSYHTGLFHPSPVTLWVKTSHNLA
jgi:hypothetical protein